jgi:hypothetical protein
MGTQIGTLRPSSPVLSRYTDGAIRVYYNYGGTHRQQGVVISLLLIFLKIMEVC